MPDFSEILKIAVEQQDWQLICGLYTNITGEALSVPQAAVEEEEEEEEEEDVLKKDYSLEDLRYQNQLPPQEQDLELVDKNIDNTISSRYNDFIAPPRNRNETSSNENRRMRSEPVGKQKLKNVVGVSEEGFVDDMTESLIDPDTGESLIGSNANMKITPRNKRKQLGMNDTSLIDAKCSVCKSSVKVSPTIAFGYSVVDSENSWICNDCNTRKGRRERSQDI